jgi:hypothetical protein
VEQRLPIDPVRAWDEPMPYDLEGLFGRVVSQDALTSTKAQAVIRYAVGPEVHYARLIECRRAATGNETVFLDLDVEVAQYPVNAIQPVERIAIIFSAADTQYPELVSLREDFPEVPHLNLRPRGYPKSLCLYLEPYAELKLHWTAHRFVERIRFWLARTADGNLHPDDQPLEPLMSTGHGTLVVPENLLGSYSAALDPHFVSAVDGLQQGSVWIVHRAGSRVHTDKPPGHVAISFTCAPQTHGIMSAAPENLGELQEFLARTNFDLVSELRKCIAGWKDQKRFIELGNVQLFLIFNLPKRRFDGGPIEYTDHVAFLCGCKLEDLDKLLENFSVAQHHQGVIEIPSSIREAANIQLLSFYVTPEFSPTFAALLNDVPLETRNFCLLGGGALGSQFFDTILRCGFGKWTVVDDDRLLPHNLARHHLTGSFVGRRKAESLAYLACDLLREDVATPIATNVLNPGEHEATLRDALTKAVVVCDCTASVPVARALAVDKLDCPRVVSLFLNPAADALVLLAEDEQRRCRLDWLEMQFYREIARNPVLGNHLRTGSKIRYSNACRSVTARISAEAVALFAAIASRAFRERTRFPNGGISIWRLEQGMQVARLDLSIEPLITQRVGRWTICTDNELLHALHRFRLLRLPNETGGVLLGTYDMERHIIYIVDMLPSPPDSEEWPTSYKRGCVGLAQAVREIEDKTLLNLEYIGEWHSHPEGCGTRMSKIDAVAMKEIRCEMAKAGLPGLMVIVGSDEAHSYHLAEAEELA